MKKPVAVHEPEYLTLKQAAAELHFDERSPSDPVNGFRRWALRWGLPMVGRGRVLLVERAVLREFLRREPWSRGA